MSYKMKICPQCLEKEISFYNATFCKSCSNKNRAGKYINKGGWKHTAEFIEAQRLRSTGKEQSAEIRELLSLKAKLRWQDPIERIKQGERQAKRLANPSNHPNWKGGITSASKKERSKQIYVRFRKQILERDKACVTCGSTQRLEVDHIKPFVFYPELRLIESNCRTLCHSCHKLTPTYARQTI